MGFINYALAHIEHIVSQKLANFGEL